MKQPMKVFILILLISFTHFSYADEINIDKELIKSNGITKLEIYRLTDGLKNPLKSITFYNNGNYKTITIYDYWGRISGVTYFNNYGNKIKSETNSYISGNRIEYVDLGTRRLYYTKETITEQYFDNKIQYEESTVDDKTMISNCQYDWKNNLECKVTAFNHNGQITTTKLYKYNYYGEKVETIDLSNNQTTYKRTITYNKYGDITYDESHLMNSAFSKTVKEYKYKYSNNNITNKSKYMRDREGELVCVLSNSKKFNDDGNIIEEIISGANSSWKTIDQYEYNKNKTIKSKTTKTDDFKSLYLYKYNKLGLLSSIENYNEGEIESSDIYEYSK